MWSCPNLMFCNINTNIPHTHMGTHRHTHTMDRHTVTYIHTTHKHIYHTHAPRHIHPHIFHTHVCTAHTTPMITCTYACHTHMHVHTHHTHVHANTHGTHIHTHTHTCTVYFGSQKIRKMLLTPLIFPVVLYWIVYFRECLTDFSMFNKFLRV